MDHHLLAVLSLCHPGRVCRLVALLTCCPAALLVACRVLFVSQVGRRLRVWLAMYRLLLVAVAATHRLVLAHLWLQVGLPGPPRLVQQVLLAEPLKAVQVGRPL